jgi:endonuclease-3
MNAKKRLEIFKRFQAHNPNPVTELHYLSHFELLVAVILSAQSTDKQVNKVTEKLFAVANTPAKILNLQEAGLKEYIKSIGLFNTKAGNLMKTCHVLLEKFHGQVPSTREGLESLPGVGRKTANVILNTLFNEETIAVDTHIFRVANRTKLAPGKNERAVEDALVKNIPSEFRKDAHHWLVLHGRYICTARKPKCPQCFIRDLCEYPYKNTD